MIRRIRFQVELQKDFLSLLHSFAIASEGWNLEVLDAKLYGLFVLRIANCKSFIFFLSVPHSTLLQSKSIFSI